MPRKYQKFSLILIIAFLIPLVSAAIFNGSSDLIMLN